MHGEFLKKMGKIFSCVKDQDISEPIRRKMVIVGDGECGKTCLVTRMSTGTFVDNGYLPTVFETDIVNVNTGEENVELVMFDTAGQEDYDRLRPFSYHDVDVAIICFSIAEPDTLANVLENWSPEIRHFCGDVPVILVGNKKDLRDTPVSETTSLTSTSSTSASTKSCYQIQSSGESKNLETSPCDTTDIVINKEMNSSTTTILTSSRQRYHVHAPVKHSEGVLTAKRIGAIAYFESSALTGDNVEELLLATTKAAVIGSKKGKKFKPFTDTLKSWKSSGALRKS